jgi:hypothetical protein
MTFVTNLIRSKDARRNNDRWFRDHLGVCSAQRALGRWVTSEQGVVLPIGITSLDELGHRIRLDELTLANVAEKLEGDAEVSIQGCEPFQAVAGFGADSHGLPASTRHYGVSCPACLPAAAWLRSLPARMHERGSRSRWLPGDASCGGLWGSWSFSRDSVRLARRRSG